MRFLRGRAHYVDDIVMPGMLHLVVVRSPLAHAVIRGIDGDAARRQPGVAAVVVAADLDGLVGAMPFNSPEGATVAPAPHPVLAQERVRYAGQPVAAVLAESRAAALDAAEQIVVDYDPLPPLLDPQESLEGRLILHEALGTNVLMRWRRTGGDVAQGFAAATRVVRGTFHIPRLVAAPLEARGTVAAYDAGSDLLTVWSSAQDPYRPRAHLSRVLSRTPERIRVVVPDVGGAFGSKGSLAPEAALAAALAILRGVPIKWVEDRRENFAAAYQGRGVDAAAELAVTGDGRILGLRVRLVADLGAYLHPSTAMPPVTAAMLLTGAYAIPAVDVEVIGVATTRVPTGPYRGAGRPEAAFIIEQMVDRAARELGRDPVDLRRRNLIPPERFPYENLLGHTYDSGEYARALDRVCALIEYEQERAAQERDRAQGRVRGIGVSVYVERAGERLPEHAHVLVEPDGRVVVRSGSTAHGQGHETTFAQIAADVLDVDPGTVEVRQGDSAALPRGTGTYASRSITVGGSAVVLALREVRLMATAIAAHLLEANPDDIVWSEGTLHARGSPARAVAFAEVAAAAHRTDRLPSGMPPGLEAHAEFTLPGPVFPFGACAAVVEIAPETGEVTVLRLAVVDDAGRIINPLLAEGQVLGAVAQGLGQALKEEVLYDESGQLQSGTFTDYALMRAADLPLMQSEFQETPSPLNPLGAKGIGEAGAIGAPAAVANAVLDALAALGISHADPPFTSPKLWALLHPQVPTDHGS